MSTAAPVPQSRKSYTRSDYNYILTNYTRRRATAAACASALVRTVGSLKGFISRNPELQKRSRA